MDLTNSFLKKQKNDDKEQLKNQNNNNDIKKSIPNYMSLYPPILENLDYDSSLKILENTKSINKKKITDDSFDEKENNIYEMDNDFLDSLLQRKTSLDRNKIINTIIQFIRNSKLIEKLESEFHSDKKSDLDLLIRSCARNLNYKKLNKGEVLFKIGDMGDRFYFILNGKVNILKLKQLFDFFN